jgi:hypothetical protein
MVGASRALATTRSDDRGGQLSNQEGDPLNTKKLTSQTVSLALLLVRQHQVGQFYFAARLRNWVKLQPA